MSLVRVVVPSAIGATQDPPGTTGPDQLYTEPPASARLPECDCGPLVGGKDPDGD